MALVDYVRTIIDFQFSHWFIAIIMTLFEIVVLIFFIDWILRKMLSGEKVEDIFSEEEEYDDEYDNYESPKIEYEDDDDDYKREVSPPARMMA